MKGLSSFLTNLSRKQKIVALVLSDCLIAFFCWIIFGPPFSLLIASDFQNTLFNLIYSNYVSFVIPFSLTFIYFYFSGFYRSLMKFFDSKELVLKSSSSVKLKFSSEEEKHIPDYKTIDLLYEKTPEYFIKKYLDIIHNLKINSEIIEYVSEFTGAWDDMVGVHIRSWYCPKKVFHSNEIFEEQIDKLSKDKKFFFCSDNSDVQQHFLDKYGDRVVTYERQIFNDPKLAESVHHDDIQLTKDAFISPS